MKTNILKSICFAFCFSCMTLVSVAQGIVVNMKNGKNVPFPPYSFGFGALIDGEDSFDPLGSYTGRTPERDEIPVQDADDL